MNILIVEDDLLQQTGIRRLLQAHYPGFCIHTAASYEEAVTLLTQQEFRIFLLDIDLNEGSEKNGIALAKYIRTLPDYSITPILFLTSYADKATVALNQTHCYSYLLKPYSESELTDAFSSLMMTPLVTQQYLDIRDTHGIYYRLRACDIVYAEVMGHVLSIFTLDNRFETKDYTIQSFCDMLPEYLIRCHKSYAVNPQKIQGFKPHDNLISLGPNFPELPVGRRYLRELKERVFI